MAAFDHLACEQSPNCTSTVTQLHVNSRPPSISAVRSPSISTVATQHVNSAPTVDMQSKEGFLGGTGKLGLNLSGWILQADFKRGLAASSAPSARALVCASSAIQKNKDKTSRGIGRTV
jgi:hypothetical protein